MKRIRMSLRDRSYDIHIGAGSVLKLPQWLKHKSSKRAFIIFDEKLTEACEALRSILSENGWEVHEFPVVAGENLKQFEVLYPLYGHLLNAKADRDSTLFALGGGSIGDVAGFIAATYMRGISWVGLPTTLLAQVDSSVGGKTGINHSSGKNLIGSFHQPELVVCDIDFLRTLSPREITSGFGEVLKYGIVYEPDFYNQMKETASEFLALNPKILIHSIHKSLQWKCRAVSHDELERSGIREVLNFGHTFGHALESVTKYEVYQHGEAVIWGMRFALALSQVRKKLSVKKRLSIDGFLASLKVPPIPRELSLSDFLGPIGMDKKVRDGKIRFVLLRKIGETFLESQVVEKELIQAYQLLKEGDYAG